ncbi:CBS domain-containing protein [Acidocella sp.]|uniref:CBS domain-containing protein n=1 Tax=Acidocella sp. TaxID=50710 RepID=UPI003CFFA9CC
MIVADVMTTEVVAVEPETSLAEAAGWMVHHRVSGLPVLTRDGRLVGILTEGDLLHRPELGTCGRQAGWMRGIMRAETLAAEYAHTHGRQVGDVMTRNPTFVRPDLALAKAAELMRQKQVKRLPVMREDSLVGMLSRFDILRALAARLDESCIEASDTEILDNIQTSLAQEPWAPRDGIRFNVQGGRVRIEGRVGSEHEARALNILARNTRGVSRVEDELEVAGQEMYFINGAD